MDAEERALLAAIIAHPDEDTPRLVYADWLQEHDQPERAEYIRLSIQLANLRYGDPDSDARYWQLREERDPLVSRFYKRWEREFAARFPGNRDVSFIFARGFAEQVHCSVKYFLDNAEQMFGEAPIQRLWPKALTPATAGRLMASPWARCLTGLHIINRQMVLALFECATLEIAALDFSHSFLYAGRTNSLTDWDAVAVRIAAHPGLKSVKRIDLDWCGIGHAGGWALAGAPHLHPDVLNLLGNGLSEPARQALRKRYGPRVWLDPADRNGFPRG
jgi:uncharacterized protein (TIGR02996 family)